MVKCRLNQSSASPSAAAVLHSLAFFSLPRSPYSVSFITLSLFSIPFYIRLIFIPPLPPTSISLYIPSFFYTSLSMTLQLYHISSNPTATKRSIVVQVVLNTVSSFYKHLLFYRAGHSLIYRGSLLLIQINLIT